MKLNGKNIIFDEDVTMTGKNLGKKLSDLIGELDSKTSKMENYLKWIYNYGGVGGSGGGGGGSNDSSGFILYSSLGGIHLNNQVISLGKSGSYVLSIDIQKPQGASFSVTYRIVDADKNDKFSPVTVVLGLENNYHYETTLNLDYNAEIIVEAKDSVYATKKQETAKFVTKAYDINIGFVTKDGNSLSGEITTADAKSKGMNVVIDYDVAVTYKEIRYSIVFNTGKKIVTVKTEEGGTYQPITGVSKGNKTFDLINEIGASIDWEPSDENAGYYSVQVTVEVVIEGSSTTPIEKTIGFNLIPPDLYLLISPTRGSFYSEVQDSLTDVYKYSTGAITFTVEPYRGSDRDAVCEVVGFLDNREINDNDESNIVESGKPIFTQLRVPTSITVYVTKTGWNRVLFKLKCGGENYPTKTKYQACYIYVKQPDTSIDWYTENRAGIYNYYRGGTDQENNKNMRDLINRTISGGSFYRQTSTNNEFTVTDLEIPSSTSNDFCTILNFGLQYNEVNDDNTPIIKAITDNDNSAVTLSITQNKITFGTDSINYYLPKVDNDVYGIDDNYRNNFHLLSVVFRYVKRSGYDYYYEFMVYVDGIIEGTCLNYTRTRPTFSKLIFGKTNSLFNLVELSYPQFIKDKDDKGTELDSVTNEDLNIYQYFLKYKLVKTVNYDEDKFAIEKDLLTICRGVTVTNWGDVKCSIDVANNISAKLTVPTMVLTIQEVLGESMSAKDYLESYYEEDGGKKRFPVSVSWSKGNGNNLISIDEKTALSNNASFYIAIQGSSTRSYKCKNYNLSLTNSDSDAEADVYLYSPNFDSDDVTTYLPEQTFTLKADVVDSSHSNNTSIGKFVNTVTNKFDIKNSSSETLGHYVRNCLDGFPFVLFIQFIVKDSNNSTISDDCYFQGMYNFNLGRDSFFNLGYKDLKAFCNSQGRSELVTNKEGGFLFYKISASSNNIKDGLIVAEIQGNSPYFDFSQYDDSILYHLDDSIPKDKDPYMFDDFVHGGNLGNTLTVTQQIIKNMVKQVSFAGGYLFDYIEKEYSDNPDNHYGYDEGYEAIKQISIGEDETTWVPSNQVPNYRRQFRKKLNGDQQEFLLKETIATKGTFTNLTDLIAGDTENQIAPWFDFRSLSEYYTICMAFGLVDSVQKNMNIKCWNANPSTNMATFYAAFYDMDTCLGINNQGEDVSYFAFSDFWSYTDNVEEGSSITTPSQITVYRDFSPKRLIKAGGTSVGVSSGDFYDTASSYLFAVAKYARLVTSTGDYSSITYDWPRQLWTRWRSGIKDSSNPSVGCLRNADKFMEDYFSNNLGKVAVPLINMNYRNKYLVRLSDKEGGTSFDSYNWKKFSGTRIAKTRDWLESRLHILDAYFNLSNSISVYQHYDSNGNYVNINKSQGNQETTLGDASVVLTELDSNEDVIVRRDIFSPTGGVSQSSGRFDFTVKAKEYSPLFISLANSAIKYLLGGTNYYNIKVNLNGAQTYKFGGSSAWTYLDSINSFDFSSLYVNSKYLTELTGTSSSAMEVTKDNIIMPSLKNITLTGRKYTGTLVIDGANFTNLNSVNISESQLNLELKNSNLTSVDISRLDYANYNNNRFERSVNISGCENITNLNFGSEGSSASPITKINSCIIAPVPAAVCKTSSSNNSYGGLSLNYTAIKSLSLVNNTDTGGYSRISISNDSALETLSLEGFAQVRIYNCPSLSKIIISESEHADKLKYLYIDSCGSITSDETFNIGTNSTNGNIADLSQFKKLASLRISNCTKLVKVVLDSDNNHSIELLPYAFSGDSNLQYLVGAESGVNVYITGSHTFYGCPKFTLRASENSNSNICVGVRSWVTSLSHTFYSSTSGSLTYGSARTFIKSIPDSNEITDISYMFGNQNQMEYTLNNLRTDLPKSSNWTYTIDMSKFKKVENADGCFAWCSKIHAWHPAFWGFGSEKTRISATYYHTRGSSPIIYAPTDVFKHVINKITDIGFSNPPDGWTYVKFHALRPSDGVDLQTVNVKDVFHPNGLHPINANIVRNFGFDNTYVNLTGVFDNWTNLTQLYNFMWDKEYSIDNLVGFDTVLNKDLPNLTSVYRSFRVSNASKPVNLINFCNWSQLFSHSANIFTGHYQNESTIREGSLKFNKYLTKNGMATMIGYLKDPSCNITGIDNLFKDCLYITDDSEATVDFGTAPTLSTSKVTSAVGAFCNFKAIALDTKLDGEEQIRDAVTRSSDSSNLFYVKYNDIFKVYNKITNMSCMFHSNKIGSPITYDFFHKRVDNTYTKYIAKSALPISTNPDKISWDVSTHGSLFEEVTLHSYTYPTSGTSAITNLYCIFKDCIWDEKVRSFDPTLSENNILPDHIVKSDGTMITTAGTKYYKLSSRSVEREDGTGYDTISTYKEDDVLVENTEISDTKDLEGGYTSTINLNGLVRSNFAIQEGSENKLFVAPDFFYACNSSDSTITSAFSNSINTSECFEGIIPENLLKNVKSRPFSGLFTNLNIIPRKLWTVSTSSDIENIYYYVPRNFTSYTALSGCFNFHLMLPNIETRNVETEKTEYNSYYILLSDSIPSNTTTLSNAFPSTYTTGNGGLMTDPWPNSYDSDYRCHYSIMYNDYKNSDTDFGGDIGIDFGKFRFLSPVALVNSSLSAWHYGRIFKDTTTLDTVLSKRSVAEEKSWIINTYRYTENHFINRYCVLPKVSNATKGKYSDQHFIYYSEAFPLHLKKNQCGNGDNTSITAYGDMHWDGSAGENGKIHIDN